MREFLFISLSVLCLTGLASHSVVGQPLEELPQLLQQCLDDSQRDQSVTGASVSVIIGEDFQWNGVAGISRPGAELQPEMVFSIASITKTCIAALMLLLVEDDELSLEDSIYHWISGYEYIDSTVTVRQLLNHTSGVHSFHENPAFFDSMWASPDRRWTPEDMIETFVDYPYFEPGEEWHYSNTNYLLAGMIIEQITGSSVSSVLRERLWQDLGLEQTWLEGEEEIEGELADHWQDIDDDGELDNISEIPRTARYTAIWTGGAMASTASDVSRWIRGLYQGEVIDASSLEEMTQFQEIPLGWTPLDGYGLGCMSAEQNDRLLIGHNGGIPGYHCITLHSREEDVTVTVLVNQEGDDQAENICLALFELVFEYLSIDSYTKGYTPEYEQLLHAHPNPLNSVCRIAFNLRNEAWVKLTLSDLSGRVVSTILSGSLPAGNHHTIFSVSNLSSGEYLLSAVGDVDFKPCVIVVIK